MGKRIYLNRGWKFCENYKQEMLKEESDDSGMKEVLLPHTCKETPYHYFDEQSYQMISGYQRILKVPMEWKEKVVLLTFEGVAHECEVFCSGEKIGEHHCGYTAFSMDVSEILRYGEDNILTVKVNSREDLNIPPFGYVIDYMTYGGIYRDVYIDIKNPCYLEDVFLHSEITWDNQRVGFESEKDDSGKQKQNNYNTVLESQVEIKRAQNVTKENTQTTSVVTEGDSNKIQEIFNPKHIDTSLNQQQIDTSLNPKHIDTFLNQQQIDTFLNQQQSDTCLNQQQIDTFINKDQADAPDKLLHLCQYLRKKGDETFEFLGEQLVNENESKVHLNLIVNQPDLWSPDSPVLYEVKTQLLRGDALSGEELLDETITVFGFRKAEFKKDGFYLNGEKFKLRGLNRHQSYPYVGYAMPKSMQYLDADILKKELGVNAVRTSHYPQSHYFIERCDEIGLLVFTEIPGWQHIGDEEWKEQAIRNVKDMVKQYRNHPSIILWGVRINESKDDDAFYQQTNAMAKELDPYRATGGVRAHKKSSLFEDVYTYNDFSYDGKAAGCLPKRKVTSDMEKAYLVTEYNGHMYPTKAFDTEEHRVEHAIRHATVLNAIAGEEDIAGSFGWCMADYNTHKDFGSGDRICYHGVLDMFRNPKLAADIYACQQEVKPVLSFSSSMDIGEHPGCNRGNTWIFSNADSVKMYKNNRFIKEYQREDSCFKNLEHGPILMDDFIGDAILNNEKLTKKQAKAITEALNLTARYGLSNLPKKVYLTALKMVLLYRMKPSQAVELYNRYIGDWGGTSTTYRFDAMKDGKVVQSLVKEPMTHMVLFTEVDHSILFEEYTYDVAAVRIRMQDQNGNVLSFCNEPVSLHIEGVAELIGENVISLKGGMAGTYVRSKGLEGKAVLVIKAAQTNEVRLEFTVKVSKSQSDVE